MDEIEEARPLDQPWEDEELVPISALEHYSYCPRQCALIHREQTFDENLYTLRGREVHQRVEVPEGEVQTGVRIERSLPLWSHKLGLVGKADVVEFHQGVPYPVEYKRGAQSGRHALLQLCAQALCLEEMTGQRVEKGAIFVYAQRRRREVVFTEQLRAQVHEAVAKIRCIFKSDPLPPVAADARCSSCSLYDSCLPHILAAKGRLHYLRHQLFSAPKEGR